MEVITLGVVAGFVFRIVLAHFVVEDARTRGHNTKLWLGSVLILGTLAAVIYLVKRNDRRLPESERPPKRDWKRTIRTATRYGVAAVVGMLLLSQVGGAIAESIYPPIEREYYCYEDTRDMGNGEVWEGKRCTAKNIEETGANYVMEIQSPKARSLKSMFSVLGFVAAPVSVLLWRRGENRFGKHPS